MGQASALERWQMREVDVGEGVRAREVRGAGNSHPQELAGVALGRLVAKAALNCRRRVGGAHRECRTEQGAPPARRRRFSA
jgi:hypothetical protein